jgi:peptide chain release factor 2
LPTGIITQSQAQRSQFKNRDQAMSMMRAKLYQLEMDKKAQEAAALKGEQLEIGWGSQIRSYVFHPYSMVKDHRTNFETGNVQAVMDGDLDGFIDAYLRMQLNESL